MFDIREAATDLALFLSFVTDIKREAVLYEQMFCEERSVEIANRTFPESLSVIRRCMFVSVLTRISAMFDPPKSMGRDNFSFLYLKGKYKPYFDPELAQHAADVEQRLDELQLKVFRNKLIAHHDLRAVSGVENFDHKIEAGDLPELLDSIMELFCLLLDRLPDNEQITMSGRGKGDFSAKDNGVALLRAIDANS